MNRIMIVDDEEAILSALRRLLHVAPCTYGQLSYKLTVETCTSPGVALARARQAPFDVVMSDYRMPEMDGIEFLARFKELQPEAERIVLSGYADLDAVMRAFKEVQIFRFIAKPWNDYILISSIAEALNRRDLLRENKQLAEMLRARNAAPPPAAVPPAPTPEPPPVRWGPDGSLLVEPDK